MQNIGTQSPEKLPHGSANPLTFTFSTKRTVNPTSLNDSVRQKMTFSAFSNQVVGFCQASVDLAWPPIAPYKDMAVIAGKVRYKRRNSVMRVALTDLYHAYSQFRGMRVSSADLRAFRPSVFDSSARPAGHSCNIGLLFSVLLKFDLADQLEGKGLRGSPFSVHIKK